MVQAMTKSELIEELVDRKSSDLDRATDRNIADGVSVIIAEMSKALVDGNRIEIRGFGSFGLKYRDKRVGRNPQDGSPVAVKARYTVFFKAGKGLRERVDDFER